MGPLLFLLVVAIAFTCLVVRSVRAGWGAHLFWLSWLLIGLCVLLSGIIDVSPAARVLVNVWALSVVFLPVWYFARWLGRHAGGGR